MGPKSLRMAFLMKHTVLVHFVALQTVQGFTFIKQNHQTARKVNATERVLVASDVTVDELNTDRTTCEIPGGPAGELINKNLKKGFVSLWSCGQQGTGMVLESCKVFFKSYQSWLVNSCTIVKPADESTVCAPERTGNIEQGEVVHTCVPRPKPTGPNPCDSGVCSIRECLNDVAKCGAIVLAPHYEDMDADPTSTPAPAPSPPETPTTTAPPQVQDDYTMYIILGGVGVLCVIIIVSLVVYFRKKRQAEEAYVDEYYEDEGYDGEEYWEEPAYGNGFDEFGPPGGFDDFGGKKGSWMGGKESWKGKKKGKGKDWENSYRSDWDNGGYDEKGWKKGDGKKGSRRSQERDRRRSADKKDDSDGDDWCSIQ